VVLEELGAEQAFTAQCGYTDNTTEDCTTAAIWDSSMPGVAAISNEVGTEGVATAITNGVTVITATADGVHCDPVTLSVALGRICEVLTINGLATVIEERTAQYTAVCNFDNGGAQDVTTEVDWNSDDTDVAVIDDTGFLQALSPGTVLISAEYANPDETGTKSNDITVTVTFRPMMQHITVTPENVTLTDIGETQAFAAQCVYADATWEECTQDVIWKSTDTDVAIISNDPTSEGVATSVSSGHTTVTATFASITSDPGASLTVQVSKR
jgi:hypothetical protein